MISSTYLPISSPFIRFAGRYVDEAFGFAAGWNFFVFEAAMVPFEITACNVIIHYWSDAVPAGAVVAMLGGNPLHDRFGFRYWSEPGAFVELYREGALGRWLGFLQCLILASFTVAGPDYVSMVW